MKLVLASGSQRRRELLTMCGYDYEIIVSNADETIDENGPENFVRALSFRKAKEVFDRILLLSDPTRSLLFKRRGRQSPRLSASPKMRRMQCAFFQCCPEKPTEFSPECP